MCQTKLTSRQLLTTCEIPVRHLVWYKYDMTMYTGSVCFIRVLQFVVKSSLHSHIVTSCLSVVIDVCDYVRQNASLHVNQSQTVHSYI